MWPYCPLVACAMFVVSQMIVRNSTVLTIYVLRRIDQWMLEPNSSKRERTAPDTGSKSLHMRFMGLPETAKIEWGTRIASTFHACLVFPVVFYIVLIDPGELPQAPLRGPHDGVDFVMSLGVGYFFSDASVVMQHWLQPVAPVMIHHVLASVGFVFSAYQGFGRWICAALLLTEASNVRSLVACSFVDQHPASWVINGC